MLPVQILHPHSTRNKQAATDIRSFLLEYLNSDSGSVSWQENSYNRLY